MRLSENFPRAIVSTLLLAGLLSACAQNKTWVPYESVSPGVCTTKTQCDAMWLRATSEIASVSGMKVRLLTDSYIETFDGTRQGRLYGRVEKRPLGQDTFEIVATLACGYACGDIPLRGESLFNSSVRIAGGLAPTDGTAPLMPTSGQPYSNEKAAQVLEERSQQALQTYLDCVKAAAIRNSSVAISVEQSLNACTAGLKNYRAAAFQQATASGGTQDVFASAQRAEEDALAKGRQAAIAATKGH